MASQVPVKIADECELKVSADDPLIKECIDLIYEYFRGNSNDKANVSSSFGKKQSKILEKTIHPDVVAEYPSKNLSGLKNYHGHVRKTLPATDALSFHRVWATSFEIRERVGGKKDADLVDTIEIAAEWSFEMAFRGIAFCCCVTACLCCFGCMKCRNKVVKHGTNVYRFAKDEGVLKISFVKTFRD